MIKGLTGFGKIVAMRPSDASTVSLAPARQLEAYWTSLRDGGDVPLRSRIDPRGISAILSNAFMVERISPSVASIRLAGQQLRTAIGSEPRGLPFGLVFTPETRSTIATALSAVLNTPSIADLELHSSTGMLSHKTATARMSLLPLRNPDGSVDRAIGVFVPDENCKGQQCRFTVHDFNLRPVFGPQPQTIVETPLKKPNQIGANHVSRNGLHLRLVKT